MTTSSLVRIGTLSAVLFFSFVPATFAATIEPPACMVGVVTQDTGKVFTEGSVIVQPGGWAYVLWVSTEGAVATDGNGTTITRSGFVRVFPQQTTTYVYHFKQGTEQATCSATLVVDSPSASSAQGATTLRVSSIPLLTGGDVYGGTSVPVSYLQVTNIGNQSTSVTGFWIKQNGSAPVTLITGLTAIDDTGNIQGSTFSPVFTNRMAFVPITATLAPNQRRLFTIKTVMANDLRASTWAQLLIDVTSVETNALVQGIFPIHGTTWTIR